MVLTQRPIVIFNRGGRNGVDDVGKNIMIVYEVLMKS